VIVFVYGTLKQGKNNHYLLEGSKSLGLAATYEKYLLQAAYFPFAIHEENAEGEQCLPIIGELYDIDRHTLGVLDTLEGEGEMYNRCSRPFFTLNGALTNAFIYEYPKLTKYSVCPIVDIAGDQYYQWS
jgi:gamma-glutamylcyclotransferase (GGCT)/AIG2-like uncharacterized protein YtfP